MYTIHSVIKKEKEEGREEYHMHTKKETERGKPNT